MTKLTALALYSAVKLRRVDPIIRSLYLGGTHRSSPGVHQSGNGPTPYLNAGGGAPSAPGTVGGGGGTFADGKLPDEALLRPAGGRGLVQWAEEGAGPWEAFIPGAESKRPRAVGILKDVADRFGYGLVQMADGGIVSGLSNLASENFPALTMTSGYRAGDPGHHGSGQAADFSNGSDNTPEQLAFANFMVDNYKPKLLELIYSAPGFDKNVKNGSIVDGSFYGASTMAGHRNHVHVAMSQPPGEPSSDPGSYDVGAQALTVTDYGQPDSSSAGMSSGSRTKTLPTSSGPVDVRVINFSDIGGAAPDGRTPKAVGSLKVFANGGIESQNPEIATTGGNVRVWAEPQAGPWEAYIPGDPAKRARAIDIWRETGKRLNITEFADGGFGGYNEPKPRDYMRPTNLMEAAALASGLGFTAASGIGGFLSMAQSGQVDLSQLMPQFDTGSNDIPGLSEAFTQLVAPLEEILATLKKGGLVTADVNVDTNNGSVALNLLSTGLA
ncbi:hypothetical protein U2G91_15580 [Rhodococcoides fascians]|uniref:hypothetical protein n=1 Tax=Rhodococcoides fascians TaxID=1828 RepID=UPI002ACE1C19|nr:hypothetical protein [Rhodococcus fascians]WQH26523.1 hypothetical protein U2G91_15580 [Rhodococcus fascians]